MKRLIVLSLVLLLGVTGFAKTNYFEDIYATGTATIISFTDGTASLSSGDFTGLTSVGIDSVLLALDIGVTTAGANVTYKGIDVDVDQAIVAAGPYLSNGYLSGLSATLTSIGDIDGSYGVFSRSDLTMAADTETNQIEGGFFESRVNAAAFTLTINNGLLVGSHNSVQVAAGITDIDGTGRVAAGFFQANILKNITAPTYGIYVQVAEYCDYGQAIIVEDANATAALMIQSKASATLPIGLQINTASAGTITKDIELQNGETIDNATDGTVSVSGTLSCTLPANYDALLASVEVDVNVVATTALYTVPTGKSCIITKIIIRSANKSLDQGTDATSNIGFAAAVDVVASADISKALVGSATWAELTLGAAPAFGVADQALNWHNTTGSTTADSTLQCDVFGYLF